MIKAEGLTKVYSSGQGVQGLSFRVREGEAFAFLGPNGSGKTTTIRLLMGFIRPQSGRAFVHGWDSWRDAAKVKEVTGYLPGEISLLETMSGVEFLNLILGMHGGQARARKTKDRLLERLAVPAQQPIGKMSKGMKQKLGVVSAFMLDPRIYILDEPTSGLDPLMQKTFVEMILEEKSRGKTIFMSSHMFPEVERTCDQAGITRAGKLAAVQSMAQLRQSRRRLFTLEVGSVEDAGRVKEGVARIEGLRLVEDLGRHMTLAVNGKLNPLLELLSGIDVKEIDRKDADLEEIFLEFYRHPGSGAGDGDCL